MTSFSWHQLTFYKYIILAFVRLVNKHFLDVLSLNKKNIKKFIYFLIIVKQNQHYVH